MKGGKLTAAFYSRKSIIMNILHNQSLSYQHLISYKCNIPSDKIIRLIDFMCTNLYVLNNTIAGAPLIIKNESDLNNPFEILLPILENRTDVQNQFEYIHNFSISNALSVRFIGNTTDIDKEKQKPVSIVEVPSVDKYYDGEKNLNVIHVECGFHHLQSKCLHEGACGWCEGTKKCISGNAKGPNEDCPTGTYIFSYDINEFCFNEDRKYRAENIMIKCERKT